MDLDFSQNVQFEKINDYQKKLEVALGNLGQKLNELQALRRTLIPARAALIIASKTGIEYEGKTYKPANSEERNAIVNATLSDDVANEENLKDEIDYLQESARSYRQLISSEQSKLQLEKNIISALGTNQI